MENFGILPREGVAEEIRALDQQARAELRKFGVRFGAYNIYFPLLLKPAAADMLLLLWALKHGASVGIDVAQLPVPPRQGLTSVGVDKALPEAFYRAAGFQVCGPRAIRIDMLERLADLIRPLTSWKASPARPEPPLGAVGRGGFKVQPEMLSIIGCSAEEMGNVLFVLGFRKERRLVSGPTCDRSPRRSAGAVVSEASIEPVTADGHAETADGTEVIQQDLGAEPVAALEVAASDRACRRSAGWQCGRCRGSRCGARNGRVRWQAEIAEVIDAVAAPSEIAAAEEAPANAEAAASEAAAPPVAAPGIPAAADAPDAARECRRCRTGRRRARI